MDPFIGGRYWVYYPYGTGEWAVTTYVIFVMMYARVGSPVGLPRNYLRS